MIGVTGDAADEVLKLKPGTDVPFGAPERAPQPGARRRASPEQRAGTVRRRAPQARRRRARQRARPVSGTSPAARRRRRARGRARRAVRPRPPRAHARAAARRADRRRRPRSLPPDRAGAGIARHPRPTAITADPPTAGVRRARPDQRRAERRSRRRSRCAPPAARPPPPTLTLAPGAPAAVTVRLPKPGTTTGRLEALSGNTVVASVPWLIHPDEVEPIVVGPLGRPQRPPVRSRSARSSAARRPPSRSPSGSALTRRRRARQAHPHLPRRRP